MSSHSGIKLDRAIEISPRCREVAEKELRETPERTREALERLKELLKENKDLVYGDDEESLTIFLRPCKWYPESAIQLMRRVAQFKVDHANVLDGLMPDKEQEAFMNHRIANVLKDRDHKGRRILIVNCGGLWDPKKITVDQMFRVFYLIHVASMLETETQIMGSIIIMDFSNMGWSQAMAFTPSSSKRLLTFIQDAMPMRLKEVHFINQPMVFNVVWNMFKPFIREKLRNRIFFHGSKMPSLHKHIPTSHLPQDYGGALPPVDYSSADWFPVLKDCEQFIQTYGNYGFAKKT